MSNKSQSNSGITDADLQIAKRFLEGVFSGAVRTTEDLESIGMTRPLAGILLHILERDTP